MLIATVGAEGVVDTGASRTVVGSDRVKGMLASLSTECRRNIRQVASKVTFRFGNSGTLDSKHALLIPTSGSTWIRVEVVQGATPLLISNRLLRELDAIIHVRRGLIEISGAYVQMRVDSKGLSVVDFAELMQHATATADTLLAESKTDTATPKRAASIKSNKESTTDPSTISTLSAPPPSADQRPQSLRKAPVPELRSSQHAVGSRKEDPREGPRDRAGPGECRGRLVWRRGCTPGGVGGSQRVPECQVQPSCRDILHGCLGQSDLDGRQAQRSHTRPSLWSRPGLRTVDCQPGAQSTLHAQLSELCPGQTPEVSADPHGEGNDAQPSGEDSEQQGRWMGAPSRGGQDGQDRQAQEASRQRQDREQQGHEHRSQPRGLGELVQIEKIEKQARQQSQQHPDESEEEG